MCRVELREDDELHLGSGFVIDRITITSVDPDRVDLKMEGSSGGGLRIEGTNVSVSGTCINGDCEDVATMTVTTSSPGTVNQLLIELERTTDGTATLALSHEQD